MVRKVKAKTSGRVQVKAHTRKQPKKPTKKVTKKTIKLSEAQMDQMIKENHPAVRAKWKAYQKECKKREKLYKKSK